MRTLYLCYFGVREPLVQTQVLPYLRQLTNAGIVVTLLTFEPELKRRWNDESVEQQRLNLQKQGIAWEFRAYHKSPKMLATAFDVVAGAWHAVRLGRNRKIDVLHARSHIPMAMAILARRFTACRLIFDVRGLMAEEYVDIGNWKQDSLPFRAIKALERVGLRRADQIVVLTTRVAEWLIKEKSIDPGKIAVIPCCVDLASFKTGDLERGATTRLEIAYAGTVTGLHLLDEVGRFFLRLKTHRSNAFLRILTYEGTEQVRTTLEQIGLQPDDYWVGNVAPEEIPSYLQRAQIGISFRKPTFAQIAASPAKISEYLAAGLPVVSNSGIGDLDQLLSSEQVGCIVAEFDNEAYARAINEILSLVEGEGVRERCRAVAQRHFDLSGVGGKRYIDVYQRIAHSG